MSGSAAAGLGHRRWSISGRSPLSLANEALFSSGRYTAAGTSTANWSPFLQRLHSAEVHNTTAAAAAAYRHVSPTGRYNDWLSCAEWCAGSGTSSPVGGQLVADRPRVSRPEQRPTIRYLSLGSAVSRRSYGDWQKASETERRRQSGLPNLNHSALTSHDISVR